MFGMKVFSVAYSLLYFYRMFIPAEFHETDISKAIDFVRHNPFGILVVNNVEHLHAVHIPFLIEEKNGSFELIAHVAKQNPTSKIILEAGDKKVIFLHMIGEHFYYEKRYPPEFDYFKDKPNTKFNRDDVYKTINTYDNAIRYTDGV